MSAMVGVVMENRLHLMSDGGVFHARQPGVLIGVMPKVIPIPRLNAAFVARGALVANLLFPMVCEAVRDFDELIGDLGAILDRFDTVMDEAVHMDNELLIGGWSEELGRPRLLFRAMHDGMAGVERGSVYEVAAFTTGDPAALPSDLSTFRASDGVGVLDRARQMEIAGGTAIGGAIYHAEITERGVSPVTCVHRWDDRIGEICGASVPAAA
ncbi:hypothetical protein [Hansschlegelia sp. KR7-227]|uniref:hypothetical protein n=1 Tax=Hansschlegelia sp. KR7-227 TaxID=3400914 RepID=UPI003C0903F5